VIRDVKAEIKPRQVAANEKALESIVSKLPCDVRRTILRGKVTGSFLSVLPSTVNGTELSKTEFRDALLLRYSRSPVDLQSLCDGCGKAFSVRHGLGCHTGGLVIGRHDDIRDELVNLASRAFKPSAVRDEPLINPCRPAEPLPVMEASVCQLHQKVDGEDKGDILVHGFYEVGKDCIFDVAVIDTDAKSYLSMDPAKVLKIHEKRKNKHYKPLCEAQRRDFTSVVVSTDGMLGREATSVLNRLSSLLAAKWEKPYSEVCGYVRARMSVAICRATNRCLRGSRIPTSKMSSRFPQWEDQAGLGLFRR
jgi:hypothetical protein